MAIYAYGTTEPIDGATGCSLTFKEVIKDAELVYTDDAEVKANYEAVGVEVRPLTEQKPKQRRKRKTEE